MKSPLRIAGFFTFALSIFAAEPPKGGYKTNVVSGPSETSTARMGASTAPLLPLSSVFDGAPLKVFHGSEDVTTKVLVPASEGQKSGLRFEPGTVYTLVKENVPSTPENAVKGRRPFSVAYGALGRSKEGSTVPFVAQPYYIYGRIPLVWDQGANTYSSGLTVFYVLEPENVTPPTNFSVQVRFAATNGTVQPNDVIMNQTERSQRVMVRTTSLERPVVVAMKIEDREVRSAAAAEGELGSIRLTPTTAEIPGFGAGQTSIRVERFDPLDRPLPAAEALSVTFSVDTAAAVTPTTVSISAGASSAEVLLKSTSSGVATVTAKTGSGPSAVTKIKIRPVLGALVLKSDVNEIAGFGAGQASVRVQRLDPAKAPLSADDALIVTFKVDGPAEVTPASVTIPVGESEATAVIKSTGFGSAAITATGAGKTSAPLKIGVRSVLGGLKLSAAQSEIADFGAGSTEIDAVRLDPSGNPFSGEESLLVTFSVTGAAQITPSTVTIPPGESRARAMLKSNGDGAVSVTATADGKTSTPVAVKILKTAHRFKLSPSSVIALGMGLSRTKVTVSRQDAQGKDFADAKPLTLPLQLSGPGLLEFPSVDFKAGESATSVVVISKGTGTSTLKGNGDLPSETVSFDFVGPWLLIAAVLLGGGIGALIRHLKTKSGVRRPPLQLVIAIGVVTVLVLGGALLVGRLGIIPQSLLATPVGAFVFGGLLGLAGTYLVDMVRTPEAKAA